MIKKHNSLIIMLVLITFMFSIAGSASAAHFTDVQATGEESAAIYKLNSLGIINGYPDGSFGSEKTITRAEFAKVACVTAGLKDVASGMGDVPSSFSDVSVDFWGNGWTNVAAAQGFMKGDPNGTFRPDAPVTQAEVVTVMLRILGYNDNLRGNWPLNYISKASNLEILDDVNSRPNKAATRGEVALIGSNTLDQNVVHYKASDNVFEEKTKDQKAYSLLTDKFNDYEDIVENAIISAMDLSEAVTGNMKFEFIKYDDDWKNPKPESVKWLKLSRDIVVDNASSPLAAAFRIVDYMVNDDDEVCWMSVKNTRRIHNTPCDNVRKINTKEIEVRENNKWKKYNVSDAFSWYNSNPKVLMVSFFGSDDENNQAASPYGKYLVTGGKDGETVLDWYERTFQYPYDIDGKPAMLGCGLIGLTFNEDDEFVFANTTCCASNKYGLSLIKDQYNEKYIYPYVMKTGIVDSVNDKKKKISLEPSYQGCIDLDENDPDDFLVLRNGKPCRFSDIQEGDLIFQYWKYETNLILAMDIKIQGILEEYEPEKQPDDRVLDHNFKSLTVNGKTFETASGDGYFSDDNGKSFKKLTEEDLDDALGCECTVMLNSDKRVQAVIAETNGDSGRIYGTVIKSYTDKYSNGDLRDLLKVFRLNDGKEVTYTIDDDAEYRWVNSINGDDYNFSPYVDFDKRVKAGVAKNKNSFKDTELEAFTDADHDGQVDMAVAQNDFVYFNLTNDGQINHLSKIAYDVNYDGVSAVGAFAATHTEGITALDVDEDLDSIKIGTAWYDAGDAVIANIKGEADSDDSEIVKWADVEDYIKNAASNKTASITYYLDNNELKYAVVNEKDLSSDSEIAIAESHSKDSTGDYVTLVEGDQYIKYYVSDNTSEANERPSSGAVLSIKWDAGEVKIDKIFAPTEKTPDGIAYAALITDVNNNSVLAKVYKDKEVKELSFLVDEDTKCFDNTDTDDPFEITKNDLSKGSEVWIMLDETDSITKLNEAVTGIVLVDEDYKVLSK